MIYETILVEKAKAIATVTINRPAALNSFTKTMLAEFSHLWRDIAEDDSVLDPTLDQGTARRAQLLNTR